MAFVVGKGIGLTTSTASADYIHLYHGNAALLTESLENVQRTAAVILATLKTEDSLSQEMPEAPSAEAAPESKRARRSRIQTTTTEAA